MAGACLTEPSDQGRILKGKENPTNVGSRKAGVAKFDSAKTKARDRQMVMAGFETGSEDRCWLCSGCDEVGVEES